jgi:hypothetical protein
LILLAALALSFGVKDFVEGGIIAGKQRLLIGHTASDKYATGVITLNTV